MATRVSPSVKPEATAAEDTAAAQDLAVLHPERLLPIAGRTLEVREYGYIEGLRLLALARPFVDDLYAAISAASSAPSADAIADIVALHVDSVRTLIAYAITPAGEGTAEFARGVADNEKWINTLNERDGDLLMLTWWAVNAPFFTRRIMRRAAEESAKRRAQSPSPSAASTPP